MTSSRDIIQASIASHNTRAERTMRDLEPWARLTATVAFAAFGAAALLWFATPCEEGHQCAGLLLAPAAQVRNNVRNALRGTWLHRALVWPQSTYLRLQICWTQNEVDDMEATVRNEALTRPQLLHYAAQIRSHQLWIAQRQIRLIDIDLATRRT